VTIAMVETLQVINQMQADGVVRKYAIGGAIGATFYLEPTSSFDIDIFVSFSDMGGNPLAPLEPIYDYLRRHGGRAEGEHILLKGWLVQFLPAEDALHQEALSEAVQTEVRGVKTWVMSAEHLIALALQLGRQKDAARVERFIEIGKYEPNKLGEILRRHNLLEKWNRICDQCKGSTNE
jgi:hypothetical protein